MRLTGQIRREEGVATPNDVNSQYRSITRSTRRFNTLKVPRKLEASLPYASKTRAIPAQKKETYMQKRAVIMDDDEKKAAALLQQMQSLRKDKVQRRKDKQEERKAGYRKEKGEHDEGLARKIREDRKKQHKIDGMKRKREEEGANKDRGKKRSKGE